MRVHVISIYRFISCRMTTRSHTMPFISRWNLIIVFLMAENCVYIRQILPEAYSISRRGTSYDTPACPAAELVMLQSCHWRQKKLAVSETWMPFDFLGLSVRDLLHMLISRPSNEHGAAAMVLSGSISNYI